MLVIHMLDIDTDALAQAVLYRIGAVRVLFQVSSGQHTCVDVLYIGHGIVYVRAACEVIVYFSCCGMQDDADLGVRQYYAVIVFM